MNTIVVWGAGNGLGLAIAEHFNAQGFHVTGISRNPDKSAAMQSACKQVYRCDATEQDQVEAVVEQLPQDAWVISTMGSYSAEVPVDYIGHRHLINALQARQINRFLMVTSLGCGDSWQYLSERARRGFGGAVREKSLAETWLTSSELDYTIVRPGGLNQGPATQQGELSQGVEVHGLINRGEVARLIHTLLADPASIGQTYACVDPTAKR
ncbi:SDR family NAD(P)-dependent oxidoreductase [Thaumasiovibrio sp. DFM-14]|uniref:SDR family NAD(P)-dependent oxidoreductase n=1 Tax=Thaumasiovibrio sp. DFM-14 TaxID=3384792 RepID=UPI0039A381CF